MASDGGFLVRYFSDGSYDAYRNVHARTGTAADEGKETDPVWGHVLDVEPVKGTWDSSDGFFQLIKDGQRNYVGSVYFEGKHADGSPSGWEGGHKANVIVHEDGNMSATGPALFHGLTYSGTPGGKLQAK